jgi:hypothetical protein
MANRQIEKGQQMEIYLIATATAAIFSGIITAWNKSF